MILLERIDFEAQSAAFRIASGGLEQAGADFERVAAEAHHNGLRCVHLRLPGGEESRTMHAAPAARGGALAVQAAGNRQALQLVCGRPRYEIEVAHAEASLRALSTYIGVVLATHGPALHDLTHLRLVLYELAANVLEHGRPLGTDTVLQLGLLLGEHRIEGWLQDRCRPFDPFTAALSPIVDPVLHRRRRGYGLHIVRYFLTSFGHEYNDTGNRLTFSKEISA